MASTRLTPAERNCCTQLSELFLDISLSPHDHFLIARALRRLDLPIDTIEHMLRYEVFPVLWTNFLDIGTKTGLLIKLKNGGRIPETRYTRDGCGFGGAFMKTT
jgi:hypothetical protein